MRRLQARFWWPYLRWFRLFVVSFSNDFIVSTHPIDVARRNLITVLFFTTITNLVEA